MSDPRPPDEVLGYYARGGERERLEAAYFPLERARTQELGAEVREAAFTLAGPFMVEGPGAFVPDFRRRWADPTARERLLDLVRRGEREPALLGVSPHLLAVGQK